MAPSKLFANFSINIAIFQTLTFSTNRLSTNNKRSILKIFHCPKEIKRKSHQSHHTIKLLKIISLLKNTKHKTFFKPITKHA